MIPEEDWNLADPEGKSWPINLTTNGGGPQARDSESNR